MSLSVKIKVLHVGETEQVTDKFTKREIIGETFGNYPQPVRFQAVQDRCSILADVKKDDEITVHFDIRGRFWNDEKAGKRKVFNDLNAWKIEKAQAPAEPVTAPATSGDSAADDLPF